MTDDFQMKIYIIQLQVLIDQKLMSFILKN